MRFNVAQLVQEPIGSSRQYTFEEDAFDLGEEFGRGRVEGRVKAIRTRRGLLLTGHLKATPRLVCSRCLVDFMMTVEADFEEEFVPVIDIVTGLPVMLEDGEGDLFRIDQSHEIDMSELVRQYAIVSIPMRPLCKEECARLCPECGANLNEGPCACEPATSNSPFSALRELLQEEQ
jgi:uncharacterized protein